MIIKGYRSPLRPVPDNVIPHSSISFNLHGHNLDEEQPTVTSDKSIFSSCKKEWWLEAIRVADSIENVQKALDLSEVVYFHSQRFVNIFQIYLISCCNCSYSTQVTFHHMLRYLMNLRSLGKLI